MTMKCFLVTLMSKEYESPSLGKLSFGWSANLLLDDPKVAIFESKREFKIKEVPAPKWLVESLEADADANAKTETKVKAETQAENVTTAMVADLGLDGPVVDLLAENGVKTLQELEVFGFDKLITISGIGDATQQKIWNAATAYLVEHDPDSDE